MTKNGETNRRSFLRASGALAAVGITGLAGCTGGTGSGDGGSGGGSGDSGGSSGGGASTGSSGGSAKGDADLRAELGLVELDYIADVEGELNMLQWANYFPENFLSNFRKAYDVTVNVTNIGSNEEMFNKLKAGGTGQYDLIFPTDHMLNTMAGQEMIQPLDLAKVPNYSNLSERFRDPDYDPDPGTYAAPYQSGSNGIGWSEEVLGADAVVDSWGALWNEEWSGSITMLDNMRACIGGALQYLGYSLNSTEESEVEEAKELLIEQKPLLKAYDSVVFEDLANAQASPCYGWSGDVLRARFETMENGESPVHYVIPKEGGSIWTDSAAVPTDAAHPNAAHAFISYFLTPELHASVTNMTRYGNPNAAAQELIDEEIRDAVSLTEEELGRVEYYLDISEGIRLYEEAWAEVKNA